MKRGDTPRNRKDQLLNLHPFMSCNIIGVRVFIPKSGQNHAQSCFKIVAKLQNKIIC